LVEVYAKELTGCKVRIELPKGKFVPRFVCITGENGSKTGGLRARDAPESKLALEPAGGHWEELLAAQCGTSTLAAARQQAKRSSENRRLVIFATGCMVGAVAVLFCLVVFYFRLWPQRQASATSPTPPRADAGGDRTLSLVPATKQKPPTIPWAGLHNLIPVCGAQEAPGYGILENPSKIS
jgi:hypothetical protein